MHFQSETSVSKFLQRSQDGAKREIRLMFHCLAAEKLKEESLVYVPHDMKISRHETCHEADLTQRK